MWWYITETCNGVMILTIILEFIAWWYDNGEKKKT